jgi:hypothetical protein
MSKFDKTLNMSKQEIIAEIEKNLDSLPQDILEKILELLKDFSKEDHEGVSFDKQLLRILQEDDGLLKRLAK